VSLSGIGAVSEDNPQLNAGCEAIANVLQPLHVVADSSLRLPTDAKLLSGEGSVLVYHSDGPPEKAAQLESKGVAVKQVADVSGHLCLESLLDDLGERGVNEVLVEAGPILNGALLQAGLVNELVVYQAAKVMGAGAKGMFALPTVERMADSIELNLVGVRRVGADLRLTYRMG